MDTNLTLGGANTTEMVSVTSYQGNVAVTVVIVLMWVLGSLGNLVTMVTIVKSRRLHTISNFFIGSLCASDFISSFICSPLWLYRRTWGFPEWMLGEFLCESAFGTAFLFFSVHELLL